MNRAASLFLLLLVARAAHADVELANDGWTNGANVAFEGGFAIGESGASRFAAPGDGRILYRVRFLYGPATAGPFPITLKVWDDTAGTDTPGGELLSKDVSVLASSSAMQEIDVETDNVILPRQFRVGFVFQHGGSPSIAADTDGTIAIENNFIMANGIGWKTSKSLGLTGDFVIRAVVSGAPGASDAGAADAAAYISCTGNLGCPLGEFCDTTQHMCTYECRANADCGGGACNSLGACVTKASGGGCCSADGGGGPPWLAALFLLRRRRK